MLVRFNIGQVDLDAFNGRVFRPRPSDAVNRPSILRKEIGACAADLLGGPYNNDPALDHVPRFQIGRSSAGATGGFGLCAGEITVTIGGQDRRLVADLLKVDDAGLIEPGPHVGRLVIDAERR